MNALPSAEAFVDPASLAADAIIRVENVSKTFSPEAGPVLSDVSLTIRRGDIYGIIGRSGAGKSTLVRLINNLERPTSGRVFVAGREITGLSGRALRSARRDIGMIFQHFNLLSSRTVAGNVALPLEVAGLSRAEIRTRIPELLDLVGLSAKADAYPSELSGGQKQRVGIARALASDPSVLLCDEATSALDPETTDQILELLKAINRRLGLTIVLITHEMNVVRDIASHVAVLEHGRLVEEGETFDVLAFPKSAVARSFLAGLVAHELPPPIAARLRADPFPGSSPVVRITFTGPSATEPIVGEIVSRFGIVPNILHDRIDWIGERPLGILTLVLEGLGGGVDGLVDHLRNLGLGAEVLGHVV